MKRETMKWASDAIAELKRLRRIERAAKALDAQLAKVHDDPEYKSVWMWAERHGLKYAGQRYDSELDELHAALKKGDRK